MFVRMWKNWSPHTLLVGIYNGAATVENILAASQKVKHRIIIWPSNSIPRSISKRIENRCSHKNLYTDVHSSIIHNSWEVKTTQMSVDWWMEKQNVKYPYNGTLSNHGKEWNIDTSYNVDKPWKHCAKWKKPNIKVTYCMTPFIWNVQNR